MLAGRGYTPQVLTCTRSVQCNAVSGLLGGGSGGGAGARYSSGVAGVWGVQRAPPPPLPLAAVLLEPGVGGQLHVAHGDSPWACTW